MFSLYMYVYNDPYVYLVHNLICLFAFTHLHMNPGMDILITSDWPREFYHFLQDSDTAALRKDGKPGLYVGSAYIAEVRATVDIIYLQWWSYLIKRDEVPLTTCIHVTFLHDKQLVSEIAPRYHFASRHNVFFQRPPYRNDVTSINKTTRFIALAHVNESKEKDMKYLHALRYVSIYVKTFLQW